MSRGILRIKLFLFPILFIAISTPLYAHAYEIDVHAYLTKEAVSFYNSHVAENKISDEFGNYLTDGARREDDAPRWMNHFYDPVNNRGFTYDPAINPGVNLGTWEMSKDWATDADNQNKLTYKVPATIASILTAIEQQKIGSVSSETDFTWQSAKNYYLNGEYEKAFFALGHILHLIEDTSVPDHTRNDPHPGDSPYEKFTAQFTIANPDDALNERLKKKDEIVFSSLGEYFDSLATYSNNNFYSKDTIGTQGGYQLPIPIEYKKEGFFLYSLNHDASGDFMILKQPASASLLISSKSEIIFDSPEIMSAYWSRLSTKAVQYSAGVIDLFFKEVEKDKEKGVDVAVEKPKSFFATILGFVDAGVSGAAQMVRGIFVSNSSNDTPQDAGSGSSPLQNREGNEIANDAESLPEAEGNLGEHDVSKVSERQDPPESKETQEGERVVADQKKKTLLVPTSTEGLILEDTSSTPIGGALDPESSRESKKTETETDTLPVARFFDVRINEIMYDVPGSDTGKEWIEILNYEWEPVDICSWKLLENNVAHKLTLARGSCAVAPGGYAIIARDEAGFFETYPGFRGTIFTSSFSLSNKGETITLKNGDKEADRVTYTSSMGASGDGNSLQKINDQWYARIPTPARENLELSGGGGNNGTRTSAVSTSTVSTPNESPNALFSFSPAAPYEAESVVFNAASSTDSDGKIISYTWDFGDGYASSTTSSSVTHAFSAAGDYTVRLAVLDDGGKSATASTTITVAALIEAATTTPATHVVISEVLFDAEGSDAGKEFIELYNPTDAMVNVDGWALRSLPAGTTTTETLASFNASLGDTTEIQSRGFLLVGFSEYDSANFGGVRADATRSRGLSNGSASPVTVLLFDGSNSAVDSISYSSSSIVSAGQSIERKAVVGGFCTAANETAEFLGNACDRDSPHDFTARAVPRPQSTGNLIEPRGTLSAPAAADASSTVVFDKRSMSLRFSWRAATSSDPRAIISYGITDVSSGTPALAAAVTTTSTTFTAPILHVGRAYSFQMEAHDQEGLRSVLRTYVVAVPSFFTGLYIYPDTRNGAGGRYAIEGYYDLFPFIPDVYNRNAWEGVVFYVNRPPTETNDWLATTNNFFPKEASGTLAVGYQSCVSGTSNTGVNGSFIFPLAAEACGVGGGLKSSSFNYERLEDTHFVIRSASTTAEFAFSPDNYVTVAYYTLQSTGGGSQNLSLVAVDDTKFFFQGTPPSQHAPELEMFSTSFDDLNTTLTALWDRAADADSIDTELVYELNFTPITDASTTLDDALWAATTTLLSYKKTVAPGDAFLIGFRARDDFGNTSAIATTTWSHPPVSFSITQEASDGWSNTWGTAVHTAIEPDSASFQSFRPEFDFSFNKTVVKIRQTLGSDHGNLRLGVYPANTSGAPDFTTPLGEAILADVVNPNEMQEQTFTFASPISVTASSTYWFMLDVAGYSNGSGYLRNGWQNAIASGGGAYVGGVAGAGYARGANAGCAGCLFEGPYHSGPADWYFKLGLRK